MGGGAISRSSWYNTAAQHTFGIHFNAAKHVFGVQVSGTGDVTRYIGGAGGDRACRDA